jgi:predicted nucleotidyltransferase
VADLPASAARLLDRLQEELADRADLVGIYVYGSLVTGDFSPACSDIDVVVMLAAEPDQVAVSELGKLHRSLMPADPERKLHCLYVCVDAAQDADRLCTYWFGDRMTQWQMKVLTQAELVSAAIARYGPWPPPGLRPVPVAAIQAAVRAELTGYYRSMARRYRPWLQHTWIDHLVVALPRAEAVLTSGHLITKGEAIARLADFGVPASLASEIRDRRAGLPVRPAGLRKLRRGLTARRIMRRGVQRLSRL